MTRPLLRAPLGALALTALAACGIEPNDPLPSFGAPCVVAEGKCGVEHVCRPDDGGAARGTCVPVLSYGLTCDAAEPVRHPPGREGTDDDEKTEVRITSAADLATLEDVRSFEALVHTDRAGPAAPPLVELGALCAFRDLQRVGGGFGLGRTDVADLQGLESLTAVEDGLAIFANPLLTTLDGLDNVAHLTPRTFEEASFDLVIVNNDQLPDEDVDAFVADLEARVGRPLSVVACNNGGRDCAGRDLLVAQALVGAGLRP